MKRDRRSSRRHTVGNVEVIYVRPRRPPLRIEVPGLEKSETPTGRRSPRPGALRAHAKR